MSTPIPPFAVQAGEGTVLETPTGDTAVVMADTKRTNGSLTVIEFVIGPKQGPALHKHHHEDELWFVLHGYSRFKAGDAMLRASTGGMAFGPRGTPHCFQNIGNEPGRLLVVTRTLRPGPVLPGLRRGIGGWCRRAGDARRDRLGPWSRVRRAAGCCHRPDLTSMATAKLDGEPVCRCCGRRLVLLHGAATLHARYLGLTGDDDGVPAEYLTVLGRGHAIHACLPGSRRRIGGVE